MTGIILGNFLLNPTSVKKRATKQRLPKQNGHPAWQDSRLSNNPKN
jgi:hypothetical protein